MKKNKTFYLTTLLTLCFAGNYVAANTLGDTIKPIANKGCDIQLPKGFNCVVFAENTGRPRHIVVAADGKVFVKLHRPIKGSGILQLIDLDNDGRADSIMGFGNYGGTGIALKKGYLYASNDQEVFRYALNEKNEVANPTKPEKIITKLWNRRQHESKSVILDNEDNIYVNIGAPSNACQEVDRTKGSPGRMPCPILDSAGGIWQFKANKLNQSYAEGVRYATGLRNVVGLDWNNQTNSLFVMQHGRDQLQNNWPDLYTNEESAELPSECMYELKKGVDAGWPYIYYDHLQKKKILAPEYGGDGKKTGGENVIDPVVAFPGHLAPNGLLFYTGNQFPKQYSNGAFVAFHGSWNRAPLPQKGFFVAFVPFKNGKPSAKWETFADGFGGPEPINNPGKALHRPCGLAQGPDGALYVTDDAKGTIYKITYKK